MWIKALVVLAGAGPAGADVMPGTTFDFPDEVEARSLVHRKFAAHAERPAQQDVPVLATTGDPPPDALGETIPPETEPAQQDVPAKQKPKR